jgi:hypothetical protein
MTSTRFAMVRAVDLPRLRRLNRSAAVVCKSLKLLARRFMQAVACGGLRRFS